MFKQLGLSQKILLGSLYGLFTLMVVFSIMARDNFGEDGFQKCLDRVVDKHDDGRLTESFKVINNCCVGAAGKVAWSSEQNSYICVFD